MGDRKYYVKGTYIAYAIVVTLVLLHQIISTMNMNCLSPRVRRKSSSYCSCFEMYWKHIRRSVYRACL